MKVGDGDGDGDGDGTIPMSVVRVAEGDSVKAWSVGDPHTLSDWMKELILPPMPNLGAHNFHQLVNVGKPLLILAFNPNDDTQA